MLIFETGIKLLIVATIIFFSIFSVLCYGWSKMHTKKQRLIIAIMVPVLHSVPIILIGFLVIFLISLLWEYLLPVLPI